MKTAAEVREIANHQYESFIYSQYMEDIMKSIEKQVLQYANWGLNEGTLNIELDYSIPDGVYDLILDMVIDKLFDLGYSSSHWKTYAIPTERGPKHYFDIYLSWAEQKI